jgi:RimJ/RimL family protein N-acetyltransferase
MVELKKEGLPIKIKPDEIELVDGRFRGIGYVLMGEPDDFEEVSVPFEITKGEPMSPFYYTKPIVNSEKPFEPPKLERENEPGSGYYVLAAVSGVRRPPNHLDKDSRALLMAVNKGTTEESKWETRFFPEECLEPEVWQMGVKIWEDSIKKIEMASGDGEIKLQRLTINDSEEVFALIDRNRVHLSQHGDITATNYPNLEKVRDSFMNPKKINRLRFGIRNKEGKLVGSINLTPDKVDPTKAEIGYYLGAEFQGHGYTRKAVQALTEYGFSQLGYREIYGNVVFGNEKSAAVLQACGFEMSEEIDGEARFTKRTNVTL